MAMAVVQLHVLPLFLSPIDKPFPFSAKLNSKLINGQIPLHTFKCCCSKDEDVDTQKLLQERFSMLESDVPWELGSVWSTMGLYLFSLHIPLSFGGLSVVAYFLHQSDLAPQTKEIICISLAARICSQALSILVIQSLELFSTLILLRFTSKPEFDLVRLLKPKKLQNERNWLLASLLGFLLLLLIIFFTSYIADNLVGTKDVNDPVLKEIITSSPVSLTSCILVYCLITPILEELIYRRFLLTSLATSMNWQQSVIISSAIFSAAHLSGENFIQLFIIGSALGCIYCWTGDLRSSITLHSLYNAFTLLVTFIA